MSIAERQRSKKRGVNQAEDGRGRADAQTEYADRRRGKPRRLVNQADGLADVVVQRHAA